MAEKIKEEITDEDNCKNCGRPLEAWETTYCDECTINMELDSRPIYPIFDIP